MTRLECMLDDTLRVSLLVCISRVLGVPKQVSMTRLECMLDDTLRVQLLYTHIY